MPTRSFPSTKSRRVPASEALRSAYCGVLSVAYGRPQTTALLADINPFSFIPYIPLHHHSVSDVNT